MKSQAISGSSQDMVRSSQECGDISLTKTALELAEAYGLVEWIKALLDPSEITQSPSSAKKQIQPPPKFEMTDRVKLQPSSRTPGRGSARLRSASPSKIASPVKGKASPRKRQTKKEKEAAIANANAASASLQSALDDAASVAGSSTAVDSQAASPLLNGEVVKVEVDQSVETHDNVETTHTNVTVEMPAGSPELPLPEDTEKMLETAKKMVEEAKQLESSPKITRKRKVEEVEPSDLDAELPVQPAKKARVLEEKLKREKVRTRAFVGVTATLVVA
jgi:hypothetical protein